MATDLARIVAALTAFYPFNGKTVIAVGAGGGQLAGYARGARRVIAVDPDPEALGRLAVRIRDLGLEEKYELLPTRITAVERRGEVVLFEFSLHEIPDPAGALESAARLAPEVLVIDHAPGSLWSWNAAEDTGVAAAWEAVEHSKLRVLRQQRVEAIQSFPSYDQLAARLAGQGPESLNRIAALRGRAPIEIPMPYRLALLEAPGR
jgi:predicted RNA methylase